MHARRMSMQHVILSLVCIFIGAAFPQTALANPVFSGNFLTHVQPVEPDFCNTNPIEDPEAVIFTTPLTGELEFDLFLYHIIEVTGLVDSAQVRFEWPAAWSFVAAEICLGTGQVLPIGNTCELLIDTGGGAPEFCLLARIVVDAPSAGELEMIGAGMHSQWGWEPVYLAGARAGMLCSDCPTGAWFQHWCMPMMNAHLLELTAHQGGEVQEAVHVFLDDLNPCDPLTFEPTEPWLTLEIENIQLASWDIVVTADATGLSPGLYQGFVEIISQECTECVEVLFTVTANTPVHPASWGRIKSVFR